MLLNEKSKYNDKEIIEKGSNALIKELGYSGFLRYIRHIENNSNEDYLKIQSDIYSDMDVEMIYKTAKENWIKKIE